MIRLTIVFISAFFLSHAFAEDMQKDATSVPKAETDVDQNEVIVHKHDLATHMGWSDQQAVFKAPRNFRSKELNEISPLDDSATPESNN